MCHVHRAFSFRRCGVLNKTPRRRRRHDNSAGARGVLPEIKEWLYTSRSLIEDERGARWCIICARESNTCASSRQWAPHNMKSILYVPTCVCVSISYMLFELSASRIFFLCAVQTPGSVPSGLALWNARAERNVQREAIDVVSALLCDRVSGRFYEQF